MAVNQQKFLGKTTTVQSAAVAPQQQLVAAPADTAALQDISKSLTRIVQLLTQQNSQVTKEGEQEKKNQEVARRKKIELGLEGTFAAVKNVAQAVVAPVKSILDQIIQFFVTLFLGKALLNLINWFANPDNQSKVRSIARFLKDWWPSLIAGYLLFGTGFGRVVRSLAKVAVAGTARLIIIAARLVKAIATGKGLKGIGQALSSGGGGGKFGLVKFALGAAATIGTGMAINKFMGGGEEQAPQLDVPEAPAVPSMGAFGGGFADLKTIFAANGGAISSKVSPFTTFFGSGGLANLMAGVNGVVSGQKGIDKVPAMLTDGEFVMSRGAVQKFGVGTLESMNAAGGGTNRPRIVNQRVYASGGGLIGGSGSGRPEYREQYDKTHGAGSYAKELARRRAITDAQDNEDIALRRNLQRGQTLPTQPTQKTASGNRKITVNGINVTGLSGLAGMGPNVTITRDNKMTPEMQRKLAEENKKSAAMDASRATQAELHKKARAEYNKIINNPNDPRYQAAWDGKIKISDLQKQLQSTSPPAAAKPAPTTAAKPAAAGAAAPAAAPAAPAAAPAAPAAAPAAPAQGIGNAYNPMNWFQPGGTFGGPRMKARTDYAAGKGKYYSSSDQKTYGNYNDAMAAKKSRMTSLESQQRLNKLSNQRVGRGGRKRDLAENLARRREDEKRGGDWGKLGRTFTSMFGTGDQIAKNAAADKASDARVKQAGAASIGRYYSSADGKYYKDYAAAQTARKARLAKTSPNRKPITPTPKPAPKVITKPSAGGGSGGAKNSGTKPSVPQFPSSKSNNKTKKQLGIK